MTSPTPLHIEVKKVAGTKPALVFSLEALRGVVLNNFVNTVARLRNVSVPMEGSPKIEARFTGISVDPVQFRLSLSDIGGRIRADMTPGFVATFALHAAKDPQSQFSTINMAISDVKVMLSANAPSLLFGAADYGVQAKVTLSDPAARAAALKKAGITEDEVVRVEGAMAYVMPRRIVNSALSALSSIDVSRHFTAFELRGEWSLQIVGGGLVILPSGGIAVRDDNGCPLKDSAPDLSAKPGPRQDIDPTHFSWPITTGGIPPVVVSKTNDHLDGFASLYAPKALWDARFSKTLPAVVHRESDNGFIGYDLTFAAMLNYIGLRFDPARFGFVIDFNILANGFAFLTVDVPCVGRSDLAYARFSCEPSRVSVLLSFVLSPTGKLVLQSQIDGGLTIGRVDASVSAFSRWADLAGGEAAVVGFIIDYVLKRVIEHNVPIKMRDAIKQEVNSKNFQLLDLETLAGFTRDQVFNQATYSADTNSVLVGLTSDR